MSPGVDDLYRFAWRHVHRLPPTLGYALAHGIGDAVWALHRIRGGDTGVGLLEKNLGRILPGRVTAARVRRTSRLAMRSYMRYFYETFALVDPDPRRIRARVRAELPPELRPDLERGPIVMAIGHTGNWDLVGAWACLELATVLTVAERLEPADLFDQFVAFRERLGMRIIGQARGEKVFERLVEASRDGGCQVVPLLADRDLSADGIEVDLCGHTARFAAGPAALARRENLPLYVGVMHYERLTGTRRREAGVPWGQVLVLRRVPAPRDGEDDSVAARTRAWARAMGPLLSEHAVDWHMLQPVFDADLDHERLARSHAAQKGDA